jgi:catalase
MPIRVVGRMVLNRNPDNFFAETEQVAFLPTNMPPGIDFSEDPLLQGRLFSYQDTQLSRLGTVNFHQIPINQAKGCPFQNMQRDGHMQTQVPKGRANYEPNSLAEAGEDGGPREDPRGGFRTASRRRSRGPRSASAPRPSPTTSARRGCSSAPRRRSNRRTSPALWCSSCPR